MPNQSGASHTPARLRVGEWLVEPALDRIEREGQSIKLEPRAMRLLLALAGRPGEVVTTEELLATVWKDVIVTSSSVYEVVAQLRKALGDHSEQPSYIATVPRKGYRLVAPVSDGESIRSEPARPEITAAGPGRVAAPRRAWWAAAMLALAVATVLTWRSLAPTQDATPVAPAPVASPPAFDRDPPRTATILWVDDKPENNLRERDALASLGLRIEFAASTEAALARLTRQPVDVVISDMNRAGDPAAGYALLEALRKRGDKTPVVFYTSSCTEAQLLDARSHGALGCATRISEIMHTVLAALEARH